MKTKVLLIGLSLVLSYTAIMITVHEQFSSRLAWKYVSFRDVVTGSGEGKMVGYFGFKNGFPHTQVRVLPSADVREIALLANASGYDTVLTTEPPEYDPYRGARVAIRHNTTLYPNRVSVRFVIVLFDNGYLEVRVRSDYFLREDWMRAVFGRMLQDIHFSPDVISRFELAVNWIGTIQDERGSS